MRIYYVFNVKKEVYSLYKDYPKALYNLFLEIYDMNKKEIEYGIILFKDIATTINKDYLDREIYIKLNDKLRYSKNKDEHIINNIYSEEVSIMKIKKTHIVINTIQSYTEFFGLINNFESNMFACDFQNNDYFFLSRVKTLV